MRVLKNQTQNSVETGNRKVKFPQIIRHRKAEATIYGKTPSYSRYRVSYRAAGKRHLRTFETYGQAKQEAERIVRDLATGSQNVALSSKDAADAIAVRDALDAFRRDTGRSLTALQSVTNYLDAAKLLPPGTNLAEAVQGYLRTVAVVQRKLLSEAVMDFTEARRPKAAPQPGKRPTLHPTYVKDITRCLQEFAAMFPSHAVADLNKNLLNTYVASLAELSVKSRNDRRAAVKMFLGWCVRQDYLSVQHRLFEADGLRKEAADNAPIDYYRPDELRSLLDNAIGGRITLAGDKLRTMLPRNCPSELKTAIRANKPEIMVLLEAKAAHLTPDCAPWLHVARQILAGEFEGADGSTIQSLTIGLRGIKHPGCQHAIERLGFPAKRRSK